MYTMNGLKEIMNLIKFIPLECDVWGLTKLLPVLCYSLPEVFPTLPPLPSLPFPSLQLWQVQCQYTYPRCGRVSSF